MPPFGGLVRIRMRGIPHGAPRGSQIVLEQADKTRRGRVIREVAAHGRNGVIVEIQRRPRMELHQMRHLVVRLGFADRHVIPGLTGNLCEQRLFLLRQLLRHPVLVDLADVHLHRLRRRGLEDGAALRRDGIEPEFAVMPEVVRAAVARVRQLPGAPRGRVVPVQLLHAVAVAHEVQHLVFPFQVLDFLERGLQDAGPLRLVPSPDAVPLIIHGQAVDGAVHPGRVRQLDARRGRDARAQFPVELADDHEVAAALDGVFDRGDAARARLRVV